MEDTNTKQIKAAIDKWMGDNDVVLKAEAYKALLAITTKQSGDGRPAAGVNTEALKTWPERIYLQHGCDDIPNHDEVNSHGAVTWCADNINELDIEYVRADLVALSSSVTANANMQATSAELDAWIVETVKKANLLCVHPEADTTIDIGRAIVAALSSPATGINMRANEPNVRLDPLLRHPGGYPLDQEDLAWRLWQARTTSSQPPAEQKTEGSDE